MTRFELVRQAAVDAIRLAATEAYGSVEKSELFGFALCTHDDLDTVFHAYTTTEWVAEREAGSPGIGFISVEWTHGYDFDPFLVATDMMRDWAKVEDFDTRSEYDAARTERFRALVEAMDICRNEGLFDAETFLYVGSTDPDDFMQTLGNEAARSLNSDAVFAQFKQAYGL